jgi:hypothetical protein
MKKGTINWSRMLYKMTEMSSELGRITFMLNQQAMAKGQ